MQKPDPDELESIESVEDRHADELLAMKRRPVVNTVVQPKLLEGEVVLAHVERTLKFERLNERGTGCIGTLFVTNYKLSFCPAELPSSEISTNDRCVTQDDIPDVPLTSVGALWIVGSGSARRKMSHGLRQFGEVLQLEVYCKDFYQANFSFTLSDKKETAQMLSILAVYAFPSSVSRVFAFDYASALARKQSLSFDVSNVQNFRSVQDFESELARLHALGSWRVSAANREFVLSETMPQFIVCPSTCKDSDLLSSAMLHKHGRIPMWCWSCPDTGVSLVRSACTRSRRSKRSSIFQALDSLSFSGKVHNLNLDKCCPVTREVQTSFGKLQELCQVKSIKEWHNDARWLSSLESARWLNSVKCCLEVSLDVVKTLIDKGDSVAIEESDGRDMSCVIASLVQLIADPNYRTLNGFQSLIQKEWIVAGHQFKTRCGHLDTASKMLGPHIPQSQSVSLPRTAAVGNSVGDSTWYDNSASVLSEPMPSPADRNMQVSMLSEPSGKVSQNIPVKRSRSYTTTSRTENEAEGKLMARRHCPIFLLFLDCVYQLTCQYPTAFEFSEFLLQHLWSTSYSCLYGSFLFDCEKEHLDVISLSSLMSTSGRMKSAWEDVSMSENSKNPLYGVVGKESQFSSMLGIKPEISDHDYLQPNVSIAALRFWSSCYLRWIPIAHSENGEQLSAVSIQQLVVEEIDWLLRRPCGDIALAQIVHNAKSESPAPLHEPYHDQPSSVRSRAMTMPTLRPESRSKTNVARGSYNSFLDDMSIRSFSMGNFAEEVFSMVERTSSLALKDGGVVPTMEASHSASKKSIDSNAVYV